jgi:anaerobic magnesium-protoporphyrin IX monomethyl ester cyclase
MEATFVRVLLSIPPSVHRLEIYRVAGMKAPPLGLAWIAAVLEKAGHKVKIIDSPTLEMEFDEWINEIKSWKPDVVGLSMLTPTAPKGYKAAKMIKEMFPDIVVIAGGPHPTFMYKEALENGIDIVVMGEGEYTTRELIGVLEDKGLNTEALLKVKGIAFKDKEGRIRVTPPRPYIVNLDELPWPARHLLPMEKYTLLGKPIRVAHVMASRGCPYGCAYCSTSYFWGRRIRFRSAKNVADEVEYLYNKYKVRYVVFADDELVINKKFVREYIKEMKERGLELPFACGARVDHVNKEFMKFLYDNGCVILYFGVESASQETLDKIGKKIKVEQAVRVFQWKKELGGAAMGSFILGFPWETIDDMKRTVDFAIKLDPDYAQFTALTPYPGTPMYYYALKHNLIEDWNWEHWTTVRAVMRGFHFTREDLARMIKYAYRKFFIRGSFLWRQIKSGKFIDFASVIGREVLAMVKEAVARPLRWWR